MEFKHTPGPWRLRRDPLHFDTLTTIEGGAVGLLKPFDVQMRVDVGGASDWVEAEANSRLIASAPDMLTLLQDALNEGMFTWTMEKKIREVIKRATGVDL